MKMIYTHKELGSIYKSDYQIRKAIADGRIYKLDKGLYSSTPSVHPLAEIAKKYPNAIFTMDSAFYFHGLTDVIPQKTYLAVIRTSNRRMTNRNIVQVFTVEKYLEIGKTQTAYEGVTINIYNKERMLIELARNKKRLAFDYYKEIVNSYRKITDELDIQNLESYMAVFGSEEYLFKTIQEEVF